MQWLNPIDRCSTGEAFGSRRTDYLRKPRPECFARTSALSSCVFVRHFPFPTIYRKDYPSIRSWTTAMIRRARVVASTSVSASATR